VPREPGTPAQIEVVAEDVVAPIEPAEVVQHTTPDQHAGRRDVQRPTLLVALPLVELALVDPGVDPPGDIDRGADGLELVGCVPLAQLRPHDREPRIGLQGLHEQCHGVGGELQIVVDQEHVGRRGGVTGIQRHGHRTTEAQVAVGHQHPVLAEPVQEQLPGPVHARVVHGEELDAGIRLGLQRCQGARQPASTIMRDQDGEDVRWRTCRGRSRHGCGVLQTEAASGTRAPGGYQQGPDARPGDGPTTVACRTDGVARPIRRSALRPPTLALRQAAPDPEPLVVVERVIEAVAAHRTGAQMRLASRVDPPFSGKKASGSASRHLASSIQARSSASNASFVVSSAMKPTNRSSQPTTWNYTDVILARRRASVKP
jgi:hypothetical protein